MSRSYPNSVRRSAVSAAVFSFVLAGSCSLGTTASWASDSGRSTLAAMESKRRAAVILHQQSNLSEADVLLQKGDTAAALKLYEEAFIALPDTPQAQEARIQALEAYIRVGFLRATELAEVGDYSGANAILDKLDSPQIAQGDRRIASIRRKLADPDRFPPALTPSHVANVAKVKEWLILANSQRETGQFDAALATYEDVLRLDKYNSAARRGMELTEQERARYFAAARDHTRSKMLNDVNGAWEQTPRAQKLNVTGLFDSGVGATTASRNGREEIQRKLQDLRISQIDFSGATLSEVVEYLRVRSRDLDPTGKGIDFVLSVPSDVPTPPISLNLRDVPIEEVLRYTSQIAGLSYRVEEYAVRLMSLAQDSETLISKSYRVPPDFITSAPVGAAASDAAADPFANATGATGTGLQIRRMGAQEFLESYGVAFGEGTGASLNPSTNMLMVRNTAKNLELVDQLVEQALNRSPKQVVIEVRLLEVGSNRLQELGFDWLVGAKRASNLDFAGGTTGNAQDASNYLVNDFPNQVPVAGGGTTALGFNPITAGLRSAGNIGISGVESVLFGGGDTVSTRAPGVLSISGVMTNPQFQGVLRALDQKKGVDLAAQPSVITRSGQKASIEISRELIYPTEFDPPQIPTNFGQSNLVDAVTGEEIVLPRPPAVVTPSTPTAFETRKTGVVLEVEPVISDDGRTVDVTVTPDFTEFLGFVNYGSPIRSVFEGTFFELTPNLIFQPIFETKKVITAVKVWDGATIALGGLVTDRETVIQDKVPLLGDAPFVGRLFKSDVKERLTKHIVFFLTVRVVDPSGARINQN